MPGYAIPFPKLVPVGRTAGDWRYAGPFGQIYVISRDPLVRDGGSGRWYVVGIVDGQRTIGDDLVPTEHYRTKREALASLLDFLTNHYGQTVELV